MEHIKVVEIIVSSLLIVGILALIFLFLRNPKGIILPILRGFLENIWVTLFWILLPIWGTVYLIDKYLNIGARKFLNRIDPYYEKKRKFPCPCCNDKTLDSEGGYDTCTTCLWEDDPLQREDLDSRGSNQFSLKQARVNFKDFGFSDITKK